MKLLITSLLIIAMITTAIIPDPIQLGAKFDYDQLPDADLRDFAEDAWEEGREESAILLLDYIVEQDMEDAPAARAQRDEWLVALAARDTALGRLKAFGWGALTGEVTSGAGMAGATVADFFVYGDVRDLVNQIVFEDDKDELIILLSAAGVATTAFPPADPAVSALKLARKSSALSEPLVLQLKKLIRVAQTSGASSASVMKLREVFAAVFELAKNTKSWATFSTLLKQARDLDQIKLLARIAGNSQDGAKQLAQLMTVAAKGGQKHAEDAISYLKVHGQRGMDAMYAALRKGPDGLKFIAKNPTLSARALKNARKLQVYGVDELTDWYHAMVYRFGDWVVWAKRAITGLLLAMVGMLWMPRQFFRRRFWKRSNESTDSGDAGAGLVWANRISGVVGVVLLVMVTYVVFDLSTVPAEGAGPYIASMPGSSGGSLGGSELPEPSNLMLSVLFIGLVILLQFAVWFAARSRILRVSEEEESNANRMKLLDNQDTWLDLPLFVGLAGTILAFILISIDAGMSRMLAYLSTVLGILASVLLRLRYYQPTRERLIRGSKKGEEAEA